jgi:hypothetical protein
VFSGPTLWLPLVDRLPPQAPLALQDSALLDVQESWVAPPAETDVLAADRSTLGAGVGACTVTLTLSLAEPPAPLQVSVKVRVPLNGPTVRLPLVDRPPLQPPLALQDAALLDDQESWVELPATNVVLAAVRFTLGAGAGSGCGSGSG